MLTCAATFRPLDKGLTNRFSVPLSLVHFDKTNRHRWLVTGEKTISLLAQAFVRQQMKGVRNLLPELVFRHSHRASVIFANLFD